MTEDPTDRDSPGKESAVPYVEVVLKEGGRPVWEKRQEEERPETPPSYGEMEIGLKRTLNLGDCNSGHIHVSLRLPVRSKKESIDKMERWLTKYVKSRLRSELDEMEREGWDWPRKRNK